MKCKLITTASDMTKTAMLQKSLIKYGWDYHIIQHEWTGFGNKLIQTYNYLKANPDITHFFYSDSYDTLAFGTMDEALSRVTDFDCLLMSSERACYPHPHKAPFYPALKDINNPFKYVNGGGWFANSKTFQSIYSFNVPTVETVDQVWFTDRYLSQTPLVKLDSDCNIFQTIAFCPEDNFILTDKVYNTITKTFPIFLHANGHTPYDRFKALI